WVAIEKPAPCWKHFLKNKDDNKEVKCTKCNKIFKNPTCDTSLYHLNKVHFLQVVSATKKKTLDKDSIAPSTQPSIIAALTRKET
ncbi:Hypothetical protein FKW44_005915, partial [Caligus rogercresseyi]